MNKVKKRIAIIGARALGKTYFLCKLRKLQDVKLDSGIKLDLIDEGTQKLLSKKNVAFVENGDSISTSSSDLHLFKYSVFNESGVEWEVEFKDCMGEQFERFIDEASVKESNEEEIIKKIDNELRAFLEKCDAAIVFFPAEVEKDIDASKLITYKTSVDICLKNMTKDCKIPICFAVDKWDRVKGEDFDLYMNQALYSDFFKQLKNTHSDNVFSKAISSYGIEYPDVSKEDGVPYNCLEMVLELCERSDRLLLAELKDKLSRNRDFYVDIVGFCSSSKMMKKVNLLDVCDEINGIKNSYRNKIIKKFSIASVALLVIGASLFGTNEYISTRSDLENISTKAIVAKSYMDFDYMEKIYLDKHYLFNDTIKEKIKMEKLAFIENEAKKFTSFKEEHPYDTSLPYKERKDNLDKIITKIDTLIDVGVFERDRYDLGSETIDLMQLKGQMQADLESLLFHKEWDEAYVKLPHKSDSGYIREVDAFLSKLDKNNNSFDDVKIYKEKVSEINKLLADRGGEKNKLLAKVAEDLEDYKDEADNDKLAYTHRRDYALSRIDIRNKALAILSETEDVRGSYLEANKEDEKILEHIENNEDFYKAYTELDKKDLKQLEDFYDKWNHIKAKDLVEYVTRAETLLSEAWEDAFDSLMEVEDKRFARQLSVFNEKWSHKFYRNSFKEKYSGLDEKLKAVEAKYASEIDEETQDKSLEEKLEIIASYEPMFSIKTWSADYAPKLKDISEEIENAKYAEYKGQLKTYDAIYAIEDAADIKKCLDEQVELVNNYLEYFKSNPEKKKAIEEDKQRFLANLFFVKILMDNSDLDTELNALKSSKENDAKPYPDLSSRIDKRMEEIQSSIRNEYREALSEIEEDDELDVLQSKIKIADKFLPRFIKEGSFYNEIEIAIANFKSDYERIKANREFNALKVEIDDFLASSSSIPARIEKLNVFIGKCRDYNKKKEEDSYRSKLNKLEEELKANELSREINSALKNTPSDTDKNKIKEYLGELRELLEDSKAYGSLRNERKNLDERITKYEDILGGVGYNELNKAVEAYYVNSNYDNRVEAESKLNSFDISQAQNKSKKDEYDKLKKEFEEYKAKKDKLLARLNDFETSGDKVSFDEFESSVTQPEFYDDKNNIKDKDVKKYRDFVGKVEHFLNPQNKKTFKAKLVAFDFKDTNFDTRGTDSVDLDLSINNIVICDDVTFDKEIYFGISGYKAEEVPFSKRLLNVKFRNCQWINSDEANVDVDLLKLISKGIKMKGIITEYVVAKNIEAVKYKHPSITLEFSGLPFIVND